MMKKIRMFTCYVVVLATTLPAFGARLNRDAEAAIPRDLQQILVIDYRAMQGSRAAKGLKDAVLPPELKAVESFFRSSGIKVDQDIELLAFASFRAVGDETRTIGIAQGHLRKDATLASFRRNKVKYAVVRNYTLYFPTSSGVVVFIDQDTLLLGDMDAVTASLEAHDGLAQNLLADESVLVSMRAVDSQDVWSLLDRKGTRAMMRSALGDASKLIDFHAVQDRFVDARYTLGFNRGVQFKLELLMSDRMTAATMAALMKGAALMGKSIGAPVEKSALDRTKIESSDGNLTLVYETSEDEFAALLTSPLFRQVVQ